MARVKRAIVSVSDKRGIVDFCKGLSALEIEIYASGGTARLLKKRGVSVVPIEDYTGFPEILDGRVKTLHPNIHGGILAVRGNREHMKAIKNLGISTFDLLVVNLYPFEETVRREGATLGDAIENIDIGGPSLLRGGAKNYRDVCVVVDPADYDRVLENLKRSKLKSDPAFNFELAKKVFQHTAWYDSAISNYLSSLGEEGGVGKFPEILSWQGKKLQALRYGENPHQSAAFYRDVKNPVAGIGFSEQFQGKELSFNNIVDIDAAFSLACEFGEPAVTIIKHTNPCGVGISRRSLVDAFKKARACDPLSAYGGIVGVNRVVSENLAKEICATFFEAVIAPGFDKGSLKIFSAKKNLRVIRIDPSVGGGKRQQFHVKNVAGGLLVQDFDSAIYDQGALKVVTKRKPTEEEMAALHFAWKVCKHVKSNAIVLTLKDRTVGIGAGQMSRVDSAQIAIQKATGPTRGCVAASDAFFPFRDGLDVLAGAGATAVIQPGGSIRDQEVIDAADEQGIAMVCTGMRHFKH